MRILIIEDNSDLAENLGDYLEIHGHVVDYAGDGVTGLHLAVVGEFDAIVLDWNLPGMSGIEVCRRLRESAVKRTPVLIMTARDTLEDELVGFETGADDFLVKPVLSQKVMVRLEALVRLANPPKNRVLKVGDLQFDLKSLRVHRSGKEVELNPIGLKLLECLMESSPNVVTRAELERQVWGEELPDSDSLRVHIHSLRAVIDKPFGSKMIQTRHGIGYRLVDPDAVSE